MASTKDSSAAKFTLVQNKTPICVDADWMQGYIVGSNQLLNFSRTTLDIAWVQKGEDFAEFLHVRSLHMPTDTLHLKCLYDVLIAFPIK